MSESVTEIVLPDAQPAGEKLDASLFQAAQLAKHRGWLAVRTYLFDRRALMRERLIRAMFRKNAPPIDQRDVDYTRGWVDCIEWMLALPERAKRESEHAQS